jgi:hypothetical protein
MVEANVPEAPSPEGGGRELSWSERHFGFKGWKFLLAFAGAIVLGLYISDLLFGSASWEVLMQLETYERHLKKEIVRLKEENAKLQKEYFELRELSPSQDETK